jgi:hypothetical protein
VWRKENGGVISLYTRNGRLLATIARLSANRFHYRVWSRTTKTKNILAPDSLGTEACFANAESVVVSILKEAGFQGLADSLNEWYRGEAARALKAWEDFVSEVTSG